MADYMQEPPIHYLKLQHYDVYGENHIHSLIGPQGVTTNSAPTEESIKNPLQHATPTD
jgi:hypothetical protein